jgi:hypothetical protein
MKATHGGIVLIWDHECPATELHLTEFLNQLDASTVDTQFLVSPQRGRFVMLSVIRGGGELDFPQLRERTGTPRRLVGVACPPQGSGLLPAGNRY